MPGSITANLSLTPKDAVAFFAAKGERLSWDWHEVDAETHAHAFTVAKATNLEVLRTIRGEVEKSIAGQGFEDFKRNLRPRLQELGWWGKKEMLDIDTGEVSKVQLGSDRRLRTIFQANVQSSYMAGRYKRYVDNAVDRPYWKYVAVMDGRTRPAHAALNGKVWRWDDPIWKVIWPPNGWGCRCRVVALSEAEFKALGVPLQNGQDAIVEVLVPINRDGDTMAVKCVRFKGANGRETIFRPDPGWDHNPGQAWASFDRAAVIPDCDWLNASGNFAEGKGRPCMAAAPSQKRWSDYGRPAIKDAPAHLRLPTPLILPRSPDRATALQTLASALGVSERSPMRIVETPVDPVALRYEWLDHIVEKNADARERFAHFIVPTLESPYEIWLTEYPDGFRQRYIGLFEEHGLLMIVRMNKDGSLLWNVIRARDSYLDNRRSGILLFGK